MEFFVMPDCDLPANGAISPESAQALVVRHASGRPFVRGSWRSREILDVAVGKNRVVLLGTFDADEAKLSKAAGRARSVEELADVVAGVPGSYHVIASFGGVVRVRGTLSSRCQVFFATRDGVSMAADRPDSLASRLFHGSLDTDLLAVRLVAPWAPWPFADESLWRGVRAVPLGHDLELDRSGHAHLVRRWSPPEPDVPIAEAAPVIREALADAVRARSQSDPVVSADLSGGMDSTSLCFLVPSHERFVTSRWRETDVAGDDAAWATEAASHLPAAEHLVFATEDAPAWFADIGEVSSDTEGPFAWIRTRARLAYQASRLAEHGVSGHLTGHGGDELFFATPLHLHALLRRNPLRAIREIQGYRALYRWDLRGTVAGLLADRSFGRNLQVMADTLATPLKELARTPDFGWSIAYRLPPWATQDALATATRLLRKRASEDVEPLAPTRPQHALLADTRLCGESIRRASRHTESFGVTWHAPYVDDRVIEAALSVRLADSAPVDRYKPALAEAMRGVVPDPLLGRRTKGEYSAEAYAGLRRSRADLLELTEEMRLEKLGLVDVDALRSALTGTHASSLTMIPIIPTLACEAWLRSLHRGGDR